MQPFLSFIVSIIVDTSFSWGRMLIALFLSVVISLFVGIFAATNKTAERIIIPIWDIFQTLPILAFFPFVIFVVVATLPGYIGINAAVIFLIVTSMVWNITFGVYEAVKTIPDEFFEIGRIFNLSPLERLRKILIPASMTKVIEQSALSWSIGLFYLVTSEIFSTGNAAYTVKYGIGVALTNLAFSGNFGYYLVGIGVFIGFVIATRFLLFGYLKKRFQGYTINEKRAVHETKRSTLVRADRQDKPVQQVKIRECEERRAECKGEACEAHGGDRGRGKACKEGGERCWAQHLRLQVSGVCRAAVRRGLPCLDAHLPDTHLRRL